MPRKKNLVDSFIDLLFYDVELVNPFSVHDKEEKRKSHCSECTTTTRKLYKKKNDRHHKHDKHDKHKKHNEHKFNSASKHYKKKCKSNDCKTCYHDNTCNHEKVCNHQKPHHNCQGETLVLVGPKGETVYACSVYLLILF
jgi:hypothetical protein